MYVGIIISRYLCIVIPELVQTCGNVPINFLQFALLSKHHDVIKNTNGFKQTLKAYLGQMAFYRFNYGFLCGVWFLIIVDLGVEFVGLKMSEVSIYRIAVIEPVADKCAHRCQSNFGTQWAFTYVNLLYPVLKSPTYSSELFVFISLLCSRVLWLACKLP